MVGQFIWRKKYAQTIIDAFSQNVKTSKHKPKLLERDDDRDYVSKNFNEFKTDNKKRYSRNTTLEAVLLRDLLELERIY